MCFTFKLDRNTQRIDQQQIYGKSSYFFSGDFLTIKAGKGLFSKSKQFNLTEPFELYELYSI